MLVVQASSSTHGQQIARPSARLTRPVNNARRVQRRSSVVVRANFAESLINNLTVFVKNSPINEGKKALAIAQAGDYNVEETKALLDKYISENNVVVFSWTTCPFCIKAKKVLDEAGAKYTAVELNEMGQTGAALRAELGKMTDRTSMPNIFIKGEGVGGCNDGPGVITLQNEGKLVPMLQAAGAL